MARRDIGVPGVGRGTAAEAEGGSLGGGVVRAVDETLGASLGDPSARPARAVPVPRADRVGVLDGLACAPGFRPPGGRGGPRGQVRMLFPR
ncbi:hypothetical protein [Streptomyces sp. NPDC059409]|uniref:hypothetical protein n=1 Tax=Streptomyces sp. NPDC059409 TaxID=3346824 RepID=UPI00369C9D53